MPEQPTFPGFEPPRRPPPTHRGSLHALFLAFLPGPAITAEIEHAATMLIEKDVRGTAVPPSRYHATLQGILEASSIPAELILDASTVAAQIRAAEIELTLDRICCQPRGPGKAPVFLRSSSGHAEVRALSEALVLGLRAKGVRGVAVGSIPPHVTLMYADRKMDDFDSSPIRWTVREFVLVHSVPADRATGRGRTYNRLGTWTLGK